MNSNGIKGKVADTPRSLILLLISYQLDKVTCFYRYETPTDYIYMVRTIY